jgi:hypothetical protein
MGLDKEEFWWRILRFNWFGHQSRIDLPLPVTGRLLCSFISVLLILSDLNLYGQYMKRQSDSIMIMRNPLKKRDDNKGKNTS